MGGYQEILQQLANIQAFILSLNNNALNLKDFDEASTLNLSDYIGVSQGGKDFKIPVSLLKQFLQNQTLKSVPFVLIPETNGQTIFNVPGSFNNIDLQKGRIPQIEDYDGQAYDFNYNPTTKVLVTKNGVAINERLFGRGYSNDFSTTQTIIATSEGQTEFFYTGAPESIEVTNGRTNLIENYIENNVLIVRDYSRTLLSSNNKINLTKGVPLGSIIKIRKF